MIKKTSIMGIFLLLSVNILFSKDSRSITSFFVETYSYGGYSWQIQDVFVTKISEDVNLIFKGFFNQRVNLEDSNIPTINKLNGAIGSVVNIGPYYSEITYSLTGDLGNSLAHTLYFDLTSEGPRFLFSPGITIVIENNDLILTPSFGIQYYEHPLYKIGGKLFTSFNLGISNNLAIWVWGGYYPNIPLGFRFGVSTGTTYSDIYNDFNLDLSILPGIDYKINDKTTIKYNLNWNMNKSTYDTISHEVVFDIKL